MVKASQLTVTLTPELEAFIETRIASGRFGTAGDVVREGLQLLEAREQAREAVIAELSLEIDLGIAQAAAGQLTNGAEFFDDLRRKARPAR